MTRICCVWLVVIDHGACDFGSWNTLFGQSWVLQFLLIICGVCFGMSQRNLWNYEKRLALYLFVGISANWIAWLLKGKNWREDFWDVVFQFWFVVGVMVYSLLLNPLKLYLSNIKELRESLRDSQEMDEASLDEEVAAISNSEEGHEERWHHSSLMKWTRLRGPVIALGGMIFIWLTFQLVVTPMTQKLLAPMVLGAVSHVGEGASFWGLPDSLPSSEAFLAEQCSYAVCMAISLFLVIVGPHVFERTGAVTWLVLLNTYGHRCLLYRSKAERMSHGMELMVIGLTSYYLGLRYRQTVGQYVVRYWFVILFALSMLWPLGLDDRLDENPPTPKEAMLRLRFQLMEAIFVVCWLTAGDRMVQPEIFSQDKLGFLSEWALLLFLIHMAVHILLPQPWNWLFLMALAPACYVVQRYRAKDTL